MGPKGKVRRSSNRQNPEWPPNVWMPRQQQPVLRPQMQRQQIHIHQQHWPPQRYPPAQFQQQGFPQQHAQQQQHYPQQQQRYRHQQPQVHQQQQQQQQQSQSQQQRQQQTTEDANTQEQENQAEDEIISVLSLNENVTVVCPVEGCGKELAPYVTQVSFGFALDQDVEKILNASKPEKRRLVFKFLQMVNALMNEGGGLVFVHTHPRLLHFWDEQVDDNLKKMIPNDTLFYENFERHVYDDHIIFRVKPQSRFLSTLNFQSQMSLNKGLSDITHGQMRRLLTRPEPDNVSAPQCVLENNNLVVDQIISFHENLNVQAKVVLDNDLLKKTPKSLKDRASKILHFWWHSLRLPEYIAAFAKQEKGGSFYLGIKEHKWPVVDIWKKVPETRGLAEVFGTDLFLWADNKNTEEKKIFHLATDKDAPKKETQSGNFECKGVSLTTDDKDNLEKQFDWNIQNLLLWRPQQNNQPTENVELVKLYFHSVAEEGCNGEPSGQAKGSGKSNNPQSLSRYVLEARVKYYHGVCFEESDGPESYGFDQDECPTTVARVGIDQWIIAQA